MNFTKYAKIIVPYIAVIIINTTLVPPASLIVLPIK